MISRQLGLSIADADSPGEYATARSNFSYRKGAHDVVADASRSKITLRNNANEGSSSKDISRTSKSSCGLLEEDSIYVTVGDMKENKGYLTTYIDYKVEVREDRPDADPVVCCRRRYSEFEWLKDRLRGEKPLFIIPAIPGKTLIQVGDDKLEVRRMGLQAFLAHIVNDPVLSNEKCVDEFLHKPPGEWSRTSDFEKTPDINIGHPKEIPLKFKQALEKSSHAVLQMESLYRLQQKSGHIRFDSINSERQICKSLATVGDVEPNLKPLLDLAIKHHDESIDIDTELMNGEMVNVLGPIQDLAGYGRAVQKILTRRNDLQFDCQYKSKKLDLAKVDRDATQQGERTTMSLARMFGTPAETLKQENLAQLDIKIKQLRKQRDESRNISMDADAVVTNELYRWERIKEGKTTDMLRAKAHLNIVRLEKQIQSLQKFANEVENVEQTPMLSREEYFRKKIDSELDDMLFTQIPGLAQGPPDFEKLLENSTEEYIDLTKLRTHAHDLLADEEIGEILDENS